MKFIFLSLSVCFLSLSVTAQLPLFKNNDKVCFIGNSITNNGEYLNNVFLYYAVKHPNCKVKFINCGISGDGVSGALRRLDKDVLIHQPNWCVVMFGMNDVNRPLYSVKKKKEPDIEKQKQAAIDGYKQRLEELVKKLLASNTKVILQKPTIYDQTGKLAAENLYGVNDALKICADYIQELANKYQLLTVDYHTVMNKINTALQKEDSTATILSADRVHPQSPGHFVMAYQFLKDTKMPLAQKKVEVDVRQQKTSEMVTNLNVGPNTVTFLVDAGSLPFPNIEEAKPALTWVPFQKEFNNETLVLNGLPKAKYALSVDDILIGSYQSSELANGISLVDSVKMPEYLQAKKLLATLRKYRETEAKLRSLKFVEHFALSDLNDAALNNTDTVKAILKQKTAYFNNDYFTKQFTSYIENKPKQASFQKDLDEIYEQIYTGNKPVKHRYKLTRID